jgi:hypothetical protein
MGNTEIKRLKAESRWHNGYIKHITTGIKVEKNDLV